MDLVMIKSFTHSFETTNAVGVLEANDIPYYLQESAISDTFPHLGQGANGIKLFVDRADEAEAIKLLIEGGILNESDVELNTPIKDISKTIRTSIILMILLAITMYIIYIVATK
ncbi:MAG: hypothetical protein WCP57_02540 [Bacteroidota bacterium]